MSDLTAILEFFATTITGIFTALDSAYLGSWSVLDIFVGLAFLDLFIWFIMRILKKNGDNEE